ncbi:hypothetical protein OsccyDRAFT_0543 [Leptolyngbyaceae cyanobacterium JSC-12]|nr:hypothetical protein OsccyDRAFT_0543 [Leptolyngbyaceae cyanobacterium JSC-12]
MKPNLESKLALLEAKVEWLESVLFVSLGSQGPFLSPKQAAPLLGVCSDWIIDEVKLAEAIRAIGEKPHLEYGKHYIDAQSSVGGVARWKVNVPEFNKFLGLPPDQRKPADSIMCRISAVLSSVS